MIGSAPIRLELDSSVVEWVAVELAEALAASEVPESVAQDLRDLFTQLPNQFLSVEALPAPGAGEVRVFLQVTEAYGELLAAIRAGDGDLGRFVEPEDHGTSGVRS